MDSEKSIAPTVVAVLAWLSIGAGLVGAVALDREHAGGWRFLVLGAGTACSLFLVRWFMQVLAAIQGSLQRLEERSVAQEAANVTAPRRERPTTTLPPGAIPGRRYTVGPDGQVKTEDR
jgi:hypothetical protein